MVEDRAGDPLIAALWDAVEEWSSSAIQRTREAGAAGPDDVADAEIRLLVEHAAQLRAVIETHLEYAEYEPADPASANPELANAEPADAASADPEPADEPRTAQPLPSAPAHTCNSADFERPRCASCGVLHWYCSICGAQRDACQSAVAG